MVATSNCNDPKLLSVFDPNISPTGDRYEIYVNGFKEGELNAATPLDAAIRFWKLCSNHELIAKKLRGEVNTVVETFGFRHRRSGYSV